MCHCNAKKIGWPHRRISLLTDQMVAENFGAALAVPGPGALRVRARTERPQRLSKRQIVHTRRSQVTATSAPSAFSGEAEHVHAWSGCAQWAARCPAPAASRSSKTDRPLRPLERLEQPPELPEQLLRPEERFHVEAAEAAAEGCPCGWPQPDRLAASLRPCAEPRLQQAGDLAAARRARPAMAPPVAQPELRGGAGWGRREGWRQRPRPPQSDALWPTAPPRRLAGNPPTLVSWRSGGW